MNLRNFVTGFHRHPRYKEALDVASKYWSDNK